MNRTKIFILGASYAGYGICRSLYPYDIPVVAFHKKESIPEEKSKYWEKFITYTNEADLLKKLILYSSNENKKPVLIVTSDENVRFLMQFRGQLKNYFQFDLPEDRALKILFDKNLFSKFAEDEGLLVPKSVQLTKHFQLEEILKQFKFPVILKPNIKSESWINAGFPKAFKFINKKELIQKFPHIFKIEQNLSIQEWIPGSDKNVYYCLIYFNDQERCISSFTGRKIRQWPNYTGSTASTEPTKNDYILQETIRIFKKFSYRGFGSIEYKYNIEDNKYYIIEPTVGRPDQQEFIAPINNMNIYLHAYNSLTGENVIEVKRKPTSIKYIDEWAEIQSVLYLFLKNELSLYDWLCSIKGEKVYRLLNHEDLLVIIFSLYLNFLKALKKINLFIYEK